jgi:hypothetical protein
MMTRELSFYLLFKPQIGFVLLTAWAMPVPTGSVNDMFFAAFFAFIDHVTVMTGAAIDNGIDNLQVFGRHGLAETGNVFVSISFKYLIYCYHGHLPSS